MHLKVDVARQAGAERRVYTSNSAGSMVEGRGQATWLKSPPRHGAGCARKSDPRASAEWSMRATTRPRAVTARNVVVTLQEKRIKPEGL